MLMQVLYGIILQHFGQCASEQRVALPKLEALMPHLAAMTSEVPIYAATAIRARLSRALARLHAGLQEPVGDDDSSGASAGVLDICPMHCSLAP